MVVILVGRSYKRTAFDVFFPLFLIKAKLRRADWPVAQPFGIDAPA